MMLTTYDGFPSYVITSSLTHRPSAAEHASHGEPLEVRLGGARRLDVGSASDALARLRILENRISSIDLVLRGEVVRVGGIPVAL